MSETGVDHQDELIQRKAHQDRLNKLSMKLPVANEETGEQGGIGGLLDILDTHDVEDRRIGVMGRIPTDEEDVRNAAIDRTAQRRKAREDEERKMAEIAEIERNRLMEEAEKERQAAMPALEKMVDRYWDGLDKAKMDVKTLMAREGLTEDEIIDVTDAVIGGQHNANGFAWVGRGIGAIYSEPPKMGSITPDEQRQIHLVSETEYSKISKKHLGMRLNESDGMPEIADFSTNGTAVIRNGESINLSKIVTIAEDPKKSDKWFKLQEGDTIVLAPNSGDQKVEIPIHIVNGHVVMEKTGGLKLGKVSFGKKA